MGLFVMGPVAEALRGAAAAAAPSGGGAASGARRVLEALVPLAYRPAVKAALLDLGAAGARLARARLRQFGLGM